MNDDVISLFNYNRWADRKIIEACRKLTAAQYAAEPVPGWASVRSSLIHIAVVTDGWLRTLTGENVAPAPKEDELPTIDDVEKLLERADTTFAGLVPNLSSEWLSAPMTLRGGGRTAVFPPWVIFRHIVNHSTYHRGQIAAKLKRLGIEPPSTDLVFWAMEQAQKPA